MVNTAWAAKNNERKGNEKCLPGFSINVCRLFFFSRLTQWYSCRIYRHFNARKELVGFGHKSITSSNSFLFLLIFFPIKRTSKIGKRSIQCKHHFLWPKSKIFCSFFSQKRHLENITRSHNHQRWDEKTIEIKLYEKNNPKTMKWRRKRQAKKILETFGNWEFYRRHSRKNDIKMWCLNDKVHFSFDDLTRFGQTQTNRQRKKKARNKWRERFIDRQFFSSLENRFRFECSELLAWKKRWIYSLHPHYKLNTSRLKIFCHFTFTALHPGWIEVQNPNRRET